MGALPFLSAFPWEDVTVKQVAFSTLKWKSFHLIVFLIQPRDSGQLHLPFPVESIVIKAD